MSTVRDAFIKMLSEFQTDKIESVTFTTFNFDAGFFEQNILPCVAGYDIDELESIPTAELNQRLANIPVNVVCDQSLDIPEKGNFRYGVLAVRPENGFFHPKTILVTGTLQNGSKGAKLMVNSCNLTISGWAINREISAYTSVGKQQAGELIEFLQWLLRFASQNADHLPKNSKEEGNTRESLEKSIAFLESFCQNLDESQPTLFFRIPGKQGKNSFLQNIIKTVSFPLKETTIISPYWSEAETLSSELSMLSADLLTLIPSVNMEGLYRLPLSIRGYCQDVMKDYGYAAFKDDTSRFTHAKVIEFIDAKDIRYLISGSANFTGAAMGSDKQGSQSNVEASLFYSNLSESFCANNLSKLKEGDMKWSDDIESFESAPTLLGFTVNASYNWATQTFVCKLQASLADFKKITRAEYKDEKIHFKKINEGLYESVLIKKLVKPENSFVIYYLDKEGLEQSYSGIVTQWNAEDDQLGYLPRPKLNRILDKLRGLDLESKKTRDEIEQGVKEDESSNLDNDDRDKKYLEENFDFFAMFQAFFKLKAFYEKHPDLNPFNKHGAYSIPLVLRALELEEPETKAQFIKHFIMLQELHSLAVEFDNTKQWPESKETFETINKLINDSEKEFIELLAESPTLKQVLGSDDSKPDKGSMAIYQWFTNNIMVN